RSSFCCRRERRETKILAHSDLRTHLASCLGFSPRSYVSFTHLSFVALGAIPQRTLVLLSGTYGGPVGSRTKLRAANSSSGGVCLALPETRSSYEQSRPKIGSAVCSKARLPDAKF